MVNNVYVTVWQMLCVLVGRKLHKRFVVDGVEQYRWLLLVSEQHLYLRCV